MVMVQEASSVAKYFASGKKKTARKRGGLIPHLVRRVRHLDHDPANLVAPGGDVEVLVRLGRGDDRLDVGRQELVRLDRWKVHLTVRHNRHPTKKSQHNKEAVG